MSLLDLVFLLCARFIALREHRSKTAQEDTLTVRFSNGAEPVVFNRERVEVSYHNFELQWKASRQMTKKELKIAEQVLRCRVKRERRKFRKTFPEPANQTEFSMNRVLNNLVSGKCKEFPITWYFQNILDRVRQFTLEDRNMDFTLEPYEYHHSFGSHEILIIDEELFRNFHWSESSSYGDDEFSVLGCAMIESLQRFDSYWGMIIDLNTELLGINISIGSKTGFTNPEWKRYIFKIKWCDVGEIDTKPACAIPLASS
jgi:hypothetical protein